MTLRGLRASFAATVVSPSKAKSKDWEGPSLRTVLVGLSLVAVSMGVFSYYRYVTSERAIMAGMAELEARLTRDEAAVASGRARGGKNAALLLEDARATLSASRSADERVNLQSFLDEWEQRYLPR